jgi:plasmid stability protein
MNAPDVGPDEEERHAYANACRLQYSGDVTKEILQVRDVDSADLAVLRERAAKEGKSLSAYVRDILHDEATQMTNAEVISRIAAEEPIDVSLDEIRSFLEKDRSW